MIHVSASIQTCQNCCWKWRCYLPPHQTHKYRCSGTFTDFHLYCTYCSLYLKEFDIDGPWHRHSQAMKQCLYGLFPLGSPGGRLRYWSTIKPHVSRQQYTTNKIQHVLERQISQIGVGHVFLRNFAATRKQQKLFHNSNWNFSFILKNIF